MQFLLPDSTKYLRLMLGLLMVFAVTKPSSAQSHSQVHSAPYYLNISHQQLSWGGRTMYVEQVLDGRVGQPAIGLIYHGLNNQPTAVLFRQGLEPELTAWLRQQLPGRPTDHAIVLCIRQLRVGEAERGYSRGSLANADLAADVYAHLPDGYHYLCSVADHSSSRGTSIDSDHVRHLASLMQHCLVQAANATWEQAPRRPVRTLAQLAADKPQAGARPAILRAAVPRSGVYHTVEQFLTNRPDTTTQLRIDTLRANSLNAPTQNESDWKGTVLLKAKVRTASGDRVAPSEVWGFSDGRQAYVRQINTYRPLTRQGDFYTFVGAAPIDVAAANQRRKKFVETSIVGIGLFASTGPDNTGQPMVYSLDLRTGQVAPFPSPGQPLRPDTAFVYVYRPLGGPPEAQPLLLNDHEVGQLRPGEYLELPWAHPDRPMRLSMGTPGGPALLLAPSITASNYVKLSAGPGSTPWQVVPVREGEAEVDALEKQRN